MSRLDSPVAIKQATFDWISGRMQGTPAVAATLTFKPRLGRFELSERTAKAALSHYLRVLNARAFGRKAQRLGLGLAIVPVKEGGTGTAQRLHYHLIVECPKDRSLIEWAAEMEQCWSKVAWASRRENRFVPQRDSGWTNYILKLKGKSSFADSIELDLLRLN